MSCIIQEVGLTQALTYKKRPNHALKAHVPTPRYGQYPTHALYHITPAVDRTSSFDFVNLAG